MKDRNEQTKALPGEPESFPPEVLQQAPEARQEYFEQRCLIEHPRLLEALDLILQNICSPGEGSGTRRPGTMVLVIGPSRVGKTTLIRLLEERLLSYAEALMQADPRFMPFASITAAGPDTGRFDWRHYYQAVLRSLQDPFIDGKTARIPARERREAMETALIERKPLAVIVDEAHHLAKAASGRRLQDQLDHLKYFENLTGVSHILVGTYEMRPFRKVNAQLACRSVDVHFPRYDATIDVDAQAFRSILWALQRQIPIGQEPQLVEQWEFLYARSVGCIGLLKLHLNRAFHLALTEGSKTVTLAHLRKTAMPEARVELALRNALESEAELSEADGADERLLTLLGLRESQRVASPEEKTGEKGSSPQRRSKPGKRAPDRDQVGQSSDQKSRELPETSEKAAG